MYIIKIKKIYNILDYYKIWAKTNKAITTVLLLPTGGLWYLVTTPQQCCCCQLVEYLVTTPQQCCCCQLVEYLVTTSQQCCCCQLVEYGTLWQQPPQLTEHVVNHQRHSTRCHNNATQNTQVMHILAILINAKLHFTKVSQISQSKTMKRW